MSDSIVFSAAIFDLDGTLLYTLEEIAVATNIALANAGHPQHPVSAYRHFVGNGAKTLAFRSLPKDKQTEEECEVFYPLLMEEYSRSLNTIAKPYDGVLEALAAFNSAKKPISVLSNKPDALTVGAVEKFLPGVSFEFVQGGRPDVPLKPAPDAAIDIAEKMGVDVEQTLYIGDSDVDMQTAKNAGMIAVGAAWGFRGADELRAAGAKIVLESPSELTTLL